MQINIPQQNNGDCNRSMRKQSSPQLQKWKYTLVWQLGHPISLGDLRIAPWDV